MASGGLYLGQVSLTNGTSNLNSNIYALNSDTETSTAVNSTQVDGVESLCVKFQNTSLQSDLAVQISGTSTLLDGANVNSANSLSIYQSGYSKQNNIMQTGVFTALSKAQSISLQVGAQYCKKVCLFGNVSALDGSTPLNITITYSNDGSTFYNSSLGVINFTTPGDFSRDWETNAPYIGIYADSAATADVYYSISA